MTTGSSKQLASNSQARGVERGMQFILKLARVGAKNLDTNDFQSIQERAWKLMRESFCQTVGNHDQLFEGCFKVFRKSVAVGEGTGEGTGRKRKRNEPEQTMAEEEGGDGEGRRTRSRKG